MAVGPFSTLRGGNLREEYNQLLDNTRALIKRLLAFHRENVERYRILDEQSGEILEFPEFQDARNFNNNARCLIAIEIEHQVSRKHLLGGAVSASVLGRFGVMVEWDEEKVNALVKLQAYWDFLRSVGKNTFETKNLIILSPDANGSRRARSRSPKHRFFPYLARRHSSRSRPSPLWHEDIFALFTINKFVREL